MQAITSGPVCPQSLPSFPFRKTHVNYSNASSPSISDAHSEAEKLEMPRPRLRFLQWIRTQLLRQSEDCLYLNIFVPNAALQPKKGKQIFNKRHNTITRLKMYSVHLFYNWQFKEVENWIFFPPLWKKKTTSKGCFTNWSSFVVVVGRFEKCIWVEEGREPERQQQRRLTESFYCPLRNFCLLQYSRMLTWSLTRCFFKKEWWIKSRKKSYGFHLFKCGSGTY